MKKEYRIRELCGDWALDIPMDKTTVVLLFNSRVNAELVKAILEHEDAHPNKAVPYPPAHINREAWKPCDECKPSCKICANYNAWDRYGKPQVCDTCEDYSNFEPDDKYCSNCGRPMTEEAWKELEKRVRGEK